MSAESLPPLRWRRLARNSGTAEDWGAAPVTARSAERDLGKLSDTDTRLSGRRVWSGDASEGSARVTDRESA